MGVHITDEDTVALYDSVTGVAFGPTFDSEEEAQHFCDWTSSEGLSDPRELNNEGTLTTHHERWFAATHDGDGMFIGDMQDEDEDEDEEDSES